MPPVKYTWSDGGLIPPLPPQLEIGRDLPAEAGTLLFGSKATVLCSFYYDSVRIIPEATMREMSPSLPGKTILRVAEVGQHLVGALRGQQGVRDRLEEGRAGDALRRLHGEQFGGHQRSPAFRLRRISVTPRTM